MSFGNIVKLNIGGTKFETSKLTLTKFNGMFKTMLEMNIPVAKDENNYIFIDRSPKHFDLILNFMRDGKVKLSDSVKEVEEIQIEAQYYQMIGLNGMCAEKLQNLAETKIETSFETNVKLNISGAKFEVSKSTLTKFDGMFKTMLETNVPVARDNSDYIFIDRDPRHFHVILNYMRDGKAELPDSVHKLKEIQNEAQYYLITGLNELCEEKLRKIALAKSPFDEDIQVLDTHGQMLQVITEPKKPVLIIYYQVGRTGRAFLPKKFNIKSFIDRYKHRLNIFFKSFVNNQEDLSHELSPWVWSFHCRGGGYTYQPGIKEGEDWLKVLEKSTDDFLAATSHML